jgi:hypothetical protein
MGPAKSYLPPTNYQLSAISYQLSAISYPFPPLTPLLSSASRIASSASYSSRQPAHIAKCFSTSGIISATFSPRWAISPNSANASKTSSQAISPSSVITSILSSRCMSTGGAAAGRRFFRNLRNSFFILSIRQRSSVINYQTYPAVHLAACPPVPNGA